MIFDFFYSLHSLKNRKGTHQLLDTGCLKRSKRLDNQERHDRWRHLSIYGDMQRGGSLPNDDKPLPFAVFERNFALSARRNPAYQADIPLDDAS